MAGMNRVFGWGGKVCWTVGLLGLAVAGLPAIPGRAQAPARPAAPARIPAIEFPATAAWLNTSQPLSLRALRGKVVLLDFWTYGCINCMHIIPDLKKLEAKYANELVVIGVHTAKFVNEDETRNIRSAVLRYNIKHPILNDSGRRYWTALGVNVWPTQVLIDPNGMIVGSVTGEGHYATLDRAIGQVVRESRASGRLDERPLKLALESAKAAPTPLSFPGKILADVAADGTGRLYIADSNHNRIIIADAKGQVEAVVGSGRAAMVDGAFQEACFSNPQGMALRKLPDGSAILYVADTNNHSIRALDLKRGTVSTVAGTGKQASVVRRSLGGPGPETNLASPWDVHLVGSTLYIAMAGPHQIWSMNLASGRVQPYAGSGAEARKDGALLFSAFAQPSGLATDGKRLFVADSESSSIRTVDLPGGGGRVLSVNHGDLFDFGDRDGAAPAARLQHPLAVAYGEGKVYIADTYNHKIKWFDTATGTVQTFVGGGGPGNGVGTQARFYEPGGLSLAGNRLYVADTNNHRICVVDLASRAVSEVPLKNLPRPLVVEPDHPSEAVDPNEGVKTLAPALVAPKANGELVFDVKLPEGHKLGTDTPHRVKLSVEGAGVTLPETTVAPAAFKLPLKLPLTSGAAGEKGVVVVNATIFYCSEKVGVCKMKTLKLRAPYEVREGGPSTLTLATSIQ